MRRAVCVDMRSLQQTVALLSAQRPHKALSSLKKGRCKADDPVRAAARRTGPVLRSPPSTRHQTSDCSRCYLLERHTSKRYAHIHPADFTRSCTALIRTSASADRFDRLDAGFSISDPILFSDGSDKSRASAAGHLCAVSAFIFTSDQPELKNHSAESRHSSTPTPRRSTSRRRRNTSCV